MRKGLYIRSYMTSMTFRPIAIELILAFYLVPFLIKLPGLIYNFLQIEFFDKWKILLEWILFYPTAEIFWWIMNFRYF